MTDTDNADTERQVLFSDELQSLVKRSLSFEEFFQSLNFEEGLSKFFQERMTECDRVLSAHGFNVVSLKDYPRESEAFTDSWYAAEIGVLCRMIMDRGYQGYHALDMLRAIRIESLWSDWKWRWSFGREMRSGKKKIIDTKEAADLRNRENIAEAKEIVRIIDEYLNRYPGASRLSAAAQVKQSMGLSASADSIVRRYRRAKQIS